MEKKLRGQGKISQSNIQEALQEVRKALLEADVNFQVVKSFVAEVEKMLWVRKLFLGLILNSNSSRLFMMS